MYIYTNIYIYIHVRVDPTGCGTGRAEGVASARTQSEPSLGAWLRAAADASDAEPTAPLCDALRAAFRLLKLLLPQVIKICSPPQGILPPSQHIRSIAHSASTAATPLRAAFWLLKLLLPQVMIMWCRMVMVLGVHASFNAYGILYAVCIIMICSPP